MSLYIDVIVDISVSRLDRIFQYRVPEALVSKASVGRQVQVPFGSGNRRMKGFIVGISHEASYDESKMKDVLAIEEDAPSVEGQLIALAEWMKVHNGSTMAQALKTVMPVKRSVKEVRRTQYVLADREMAENLLAKSRKNKRDKARVRLLEALLESGCLPRETVKGVLQIPPTTLKAVLQTGAMTEESSQIYRNPEIHRLPGWQETVLNDEQQMVVEAIWQHAGSLENHWSESEAVHLLYGITGSGKTEVYMALMERMLAMGRQVIVLIPEISLTMQTVSRFYARFGNQIAIMNSRLSAGERYDQYMRARRGEASIMIGPRSALFTPFERLGMIIIDEEHESAYKSETTPRYHARETAIARAELAKAMVVLGSATPSVTSYRRALDGQYGLHRLTMRAREGSILPEVRIVDLREEFRMKNRGILSGELRQAMTRCLAAGEQMMLFINRRGYAGFVSCRSCGYVMKCRHCDVSLTAHHNGLLKCHYCGAEARLPQRCPSCGSPYIAAFGAGTQKVEDFVKAEFPGARVLRMDKDTTSGKDDMARILQTFAEGGADILIGTQMIVKGHDFANVTLVGVLAADLSMFSGDYLSSERTFQLLTQAAGRAGRDRKPGQVIIQTYQPEHYCIQTAAAQDYEAFYQQEIIFRGMMHYPPVTQMLMILAEGPDDGQTAKAVYKLKALAQEAEEEIQDDGNSAAVCSGAAVRRAVELIGPTRASISKGRDMYRYVLYMKHNNENELIRVKDYLERYLEQSGQYKNIFINFDFNPAVLA